MIHLILAALISLSSFAVEWEKYSSAVGIVLKKNSGRTVCTGVLLEEDIVLTTGHCLTDLKSATIILGNKITAFDFKGITHRRIKAASWVIHPNLYKNDETKVDLGLIFLKQKIAENINYPVLFTSALIYKGLELQRIGFGKRAEGNIRFFADEKITEVWKSYFVAADKTAVGGDSGGPIYIDNSPLFLVAIHTGRGIDSAGQLLETSHSQPLNTGLARNWLSSEIKKYKAE